MKIDLEQIRSLLDVVSTTDIIEITIESGEEKITIKKQQTLIASSIELPAVAGRGASFTIPQETKQAEAKREIQEEEENKSNGLIPITSPMVGTFYRSPSPQAAPFVDVGDMISPGQTVCIIEAMKLMNDMPAEIAGRIVKVCVENGSTVEYGQPLFMINPKA